MHPVNYKLLILDYGKYFSFNRTIKTISETCRQLGEAFYFTMEAVIGAKKQLLQITVSVFAYRN